MNKGFLFITSSWKIKSHVVESQITLLVWWCLNHLQRNIAQLITWSFLMIKSVSFTSAAFEAFAKAYLRFLVSSSPKKCWGAEVIKFLGILKEYVSKNKIYFCSRKKSNVWLNKKVIFVFYAIFKLEFIMQIIYRIIHRCLCSHFILFYSLISVSKKCDIETMLTFSYSYNWQELRITKWMKKEAKSIRVWILNM